MSITHKNENKSSRKKRMMIFFYLIIALFILVPVVGLAYLSITSPQPEIPGVVDGKLPLCPSSPNCVCSFDKDEEHSIEPIRIEGDPLQIFIKLKEIIKKQARSEIIVSQENYLHCEFHSLLFRYVDDVEFLLKPEEKLIHVRSASRAGHSDFQVNRKRIESLRSLLQ